MKMVIHKHIIRTNVPYSAAYSLDRIEVPAGGEFMPIVRKDDKGQICVYEMHHVFANDDLPKLAHEIVVVGTGIEIESLDDQWVYLGTYQDAWFIGHVFWREAV